MRRRSIYVLILFFVFAVSSCKRKTAVSDCGVERWQVKTLSDVDTTKIDFYDLVETSVRGQKYLKDAGVTSTSLRQASETTLYSMECLLVGYKLEDDKDIHLIITDEVTGDSMVAEIPGVDCDAIQHTSRYQNFKNLQGWFTQNIGEPTDRFTYPPKPIRIRLAGIGFYDTPHEHEPKGMLPNHREIHPVLSMSVVN